MNRLLDHAPVLISLVLASFYGIGLMYHQSFLRAFGIEETQFPLSIDRTFYQGFFALAELTAPNIMFVILCAAGVVLTVYFATLFLVVAKRVNVAKSLLTKVRDLFSSNSEKVEFHPAIEKFTEFSTKVFWYVSAAVLSYLSVLLVLIAAEHAGKANAQRYKDKIANNEIAEDTLLVETSKGQLETYKGYSIVCNTSQCAYFDGNTTSVFNDSLVKTLNSKPINQQDLIH